MPLGMEVGLSIGDFVRWGPSPLFQKGRSPHNFRPTSILAKWLNGSRCHLVRRYASAYATLCSMWTQLHPEKRAHPSHSIFAPCLLWPNGWMDEDAAWYGSRPRPEPHCTTRGPSSRERSTVTTLFSAHVYCGHGRPSQLLLNSLNFAVMQRVARVCQQQLILVTRATLAGAGISRRVSVTSRCSRPY